MLGDVLKDNFVRFMVTGQQDSSPRLGDFTESWGVPERTLGIFFLKNLEISLRFLILYSSDIPQNYVVEERINRNGWMIISVISHFFARTNLCMCGKSSVRLVKPSF